MTDATCPFCNLTGADVFYSGQLLIGIRDQFPVSDGHALLIPRRHFRDWFDATAGEHMELLEAMRQSKIEIERRHAPDGYNLGINMGPAAGQTIFHAHVHLIPRYQSDVPDPRGGVRHVIPGKANYLLPTEDPGAGSAKRGGPPHNRPLVSGGADPFLPHLIAHLARAEAVDIAVAFTLESGVRLLESHLQDVLNRGGRVRFLTGDYLGTTDPDALMRLLDLEKDVHLRVFESGNFSFHPKAYIIHQQGGEGTAFVGSSNLSEMALQVGVEWNYRVITSRDAEGFAAVRAAFDALFDHPRTRPLDVPWIEAYLARRIQPLPEVAGMMPDAPAALPAPHSVQQEALEALIQTRESGNAAGLVVLGTGLGKTWLSAFDSDRPEFKRVLFVAHRDEILGQALRTFRAVRPSASLGRYTGAEKASDADVLFASIQTLGKQRHLEQFDRRRFDYVVVDEFHHASARTYRRLIDHFQPKFLLGLTATPERTDGGDLLALCDENLVYRCDLVEGIRRGLLSPFDYYGVPDQVDYRNIPWRSSRFDEEELTAAVATRSRAQNALEQFRKHAGPQARAIGFCVSKRHADFMAQFFREAGLNAVAVHSGAGSAPRASSLEQLEASQLDIVFAVDMFNEGVDLPNVDTILMLRPTESRILWLQQFGRGLRKLEGKRLKVVDYIGNHRSFLVKPRTLLQLGDRDAELKYALGSLDAGTYELPPGCSVMYDLEAKEILRALLRLPARGEAMKEAIRLYYLDFQERHGVRPVAVEAFHDGYNPRSTREAYGSWLAFVKAMDGLSTEEIAALQHSSAFLDTLETTPMTKSYKMLVLLAMLAEDKLPGTIAIGDLATAFAAVAGRSAVLRADVGPAIDDPVRLRQLIETNPVAAWAGGQGTGGTAYFTYDGTNFATSFQVDPELRSAFQGLAREIADWRLATYLQRTSIDDEPERITCRVTQSGGKPIIFPLEREKQSGIPMGWCDVLIDGSVHQANFVKVAVNVVRRAGSEENVLPEILWNWFGPDAGQPGTSHMVAFERSDEGLAMMPLARSVPPQAAELWSRYKRKQIPVLFGLEFSEAIWRTGFVSRPGNLFLLVTLEKEGMQQAHRYADKFLSPELFQWQSQNQTTQAGKHGQLISQHQQRNVDVHLFVRKGKLFETKAAAFVYCGEVDFQRWEGENPITVWWKLRHPLPERLVSEFFSE